jgi:transcriptional regulator with XRE-family HTH domain
VTPADLKAARLALGLSQAAMAERLRIPRNTWHRWERGILPVEKPEILRLALERLRGAP